MKKTITKQAETIAQLKKISKEGDKSIKEYQAVIARLQKSIDRQVSTNAKLQKAQDALVTRLNVVDNAHTPSSKDLMRQTRKERSVEEKKRTAGRPGPPDGQ